jgi:hypothetical protein
VSDFCLDIEVIEHHHEVMPIMNRERMYAKRTVAYLLFTDIERMVWCS